MLFKLPFQSARLLRVVCAFVLVKNILILEALAQAEHALLPPVNLYAQLPNISDLALSPEGDYIAARMILNGQSLVVMRALASSEMPAIAAFKNLHIQEFEWANNNRLIMSLRGTDSVLGNLLNVTRLASIDREAEDIKMFPMTENIHGVYLQHPQIVDWLPNEPEYVLAALDSDESKFFHPEVDKVHVETGKKTRIQRNERGIIEWLADSEGQVRIGVAFDRKPSGRRGTQVSLFHRADKNVRWDEIRSTEVSDESLLWPVRFHPENPNILLVVSRALSETSASSKENALYEYNLLSGELGDQYINEKEQAIVALAGKEFSGFKVEIEAKAQNVPRYIVKVYSDVKPPSYYFFDATQRSGTFQLVGDEYPQLASLDHAEMLELSYSARDGLDIPAYLTLPKQRSGEGKPPLIVMPHGGPWARDYWGFDRYVQFFASRGYAVFQPQFRGSTGFGIAHEAAGYGEWGLGIQDDITDGVRWLVEQGYVDSERICIYGASFGGYAAAMGLVKTPELYKCAVAENGVFDLKKTYSSVSQSVFAELNQDMLNDRAELEANSPYHNAKSIRSPLLIIGSDRDTVVPYKQHAKRFYNKLRKLDKQVELTTLEGGEHWRTNEAHELIKMTAIEEFLANHLGSELPN